MLGIVEEDALVGVVVDGAGFAEEAAEGEWCDVGCREMCDGSEVVDLQEAVCAGEGGEGEGMVGIDGGGDRCDVDAGKVHDAALCGEEYGGIGLCDGVGVETDFATDGLLGGIGTGGCKFERPYSIGSESVEGELAKLSL